MLKFTAAILALFMTAIPVIALDLEEIGTIAATIDGEIITQPTVLVRDANEATAYLFLAGYGFSAFTIAGYSTDNKRLSLEIDYMSDQPGPATAPINLTLTYSPNGKQQHWTSDGAPTPAAVTFSTLEIAGNEGRAVGTFAAVLCYAENYETGSDPGNCRPIKGRFDTRFFVEK